MIARLTLVSWLVGSAISLSGCALDTEDEDEEISSASDELRAGVNSGACKRSPYNCSLRPGGKGQRVRRADGPETWSMDTGWLAARGYVDPATKQPVVPVLDGDGNEIGRTKKLAFTFNHGQTRRLGNLTCGYVLSSGLKSGGWVPIDGLRSAASFREKVGEVNARGGTLKKLACYEVKTSFPDRLLNYKVVKGSTDKDAQEPDDYLPVVRANGKPYINLAFNVPGDALGGPSVDIFPSGTKFQRLDVPTWERPDRPSLDATLYAKPAGSSTYTRPAGEMKFIYGYVKSKTGSVRYGWMALDGLTPSGGCPNR